LHGLLLNYTLVEAVGIPQTFIALRASLPFISPDYERVFVVPSGELRELAQAYAALQREYGTKAPDVVHSMSDAYEVLQLDRPNFRTTADVWEFQRRNPSGSWRLRQHHVDFP
jgi:hypothetical protein